MIRSIRQLSRKKKIAVLFVLLFLTVENIVLSFNNLQNKRAVIGLRVHGIPVGGADRLRIASLLEKEINASYHPIKFSYQEKLFEIKPEDLITSIDNDAKANQIIGEGRSGTVVQKFIEQQKALFGFKDVPLPKVISQTFLTLKLLALQDEVNVDPLPSRPDFRGNIDTTLPPSDGVKINTGKLTVLIMDAMLHPPKQPIPLPVLKTFASHHTEEEVAKIRMQAKEALQSSISLSSGGLIFTLTPDDIRTLLTVVERPNAKNPKTMSLQLRLDDKMLNRKLGAFAAKVEEVTNAEFDDHDARVAIYAQFYVNNRRLVRIPTGKNLGKKNVLGATTVQTNKIAYLTFDDGPNSIYHPLILDILKHYNIKATFFLVGQNAQRDTDVAKRTVAEGHIIGNHSLTHSFLPNLSANAIYSELQTTDTILSPIYQKNIELFRPPYGGVNVAVKQNADRLGLKLFLWDVDPRDWSEPAPDELVRRVVSATMNGSDILLHSNHLATVRALPRIIESLRSLGYSFELLR